MVVKLVKRFILPSLIILGLVYPETLPAGSFSISPVRLTLSQQSGSEVITVRNDGSETTVVQIEVVKWSQDSNQDHFTPTRELLATPPIFTIPAGDSQIIRVGLRHPSAEPVEQAYRMFLQEVPPPPQPGSQGLQMALRISMPVFITPAHAIAPKLQWQATRGSDNNIQLSVNNIGDAHTHLTALKVYRAKDPTPLYESKLFNYLLPGTAYSWSFNPNQKIATNAMLRIETSSEIGQSSYDIAFDKR